MTMGRPKTELVLTDDERSQLQSFARSRSLPSALSDRARIVLRSADGEANNSPHVADSGMFSASLGVGQVEDGACARHREEPGGGRQTALHDP